MGAQHEARVGDHHRRAGLVVAAGDQFGVGLGPQVGAGWVAGRAGWGQGLAAWGQQRDEAGDVHGRVRPGALRGPQYQLGAAHLDPADAAGVAAVQGIDRAGVHHRLAARHRWSTMVGR